jgi:hypothetical protein
LGVAFRKANPLGLTEGYVELVCIPSGAIGTPHKPELVFLKKDILFSNARLIEAIERVMRAEMSPADV